jgi:para-nitrobenzyl esterase
MIKKTLSRGVLAAGFFLHGAVSQGAIIQVAQGTLNGASGNGIDSYLGVPYAAAPTGTNRWRMPMPAPAWTGVRSATQFASSCEQDTSTGFGPYTSEYMVPGAVSEDCLYLNIWRPTHPAHTSMPIMVWIPGGGFTSGSGSVPVYNGAPMASKGVIVVNINYRLGVFGFLAHPQLSKEGPGSGNFGFADIVAAMKWVKANAAALGGDPDRITVAGQSAGSMAIHDMIASPVAKNLFARAISESGPGMGQPLMPLATAESVGEQLFKAAKVTSIDELRELPAERVRDAEKSFGPGLLRFAPVIDGVLIPQAPYNNAKGSYSDTPILAGMNANEAFSLPPADLPTLRADVKTLFGDMAGEAAALYGTDGAIDVKSKAREIRRERGIASTWWWASSRAQTSSQPIYLYLFSHVEPGTEEWGAFHTSEVPYALGNLNVPSKRVLTEEDKRLSDQMFGYWANFVKTGNPNTADRPAWAPFDLKNPSMMRLDVHSKMHPMLSREKQRFYQRVISDGGQLSLF